MILDKIVAYKREKLRKEKKEKPLDEIIKGIDKTLKRVDFKKAILNSKHLGIIAEIKKASPSKGIIREDFYPIEIGKAYEKSQVEAISVLTEDKFFKGNNSYLKQLKKEVNTPILRKDFIIDPYQIYQSKELGADAILLIAAILTKKELMQFQRIAKKIDVDCLVEVHNKEELEMVLETDAEIIGINNRNLKKFVTDIKTTKELIYFIPKNKVIVSESGIHLIRDMDYLKKIGVNAVLIGESLMKAKSIGEKIKELRGGI